MCPVSVCLSVSRSNCSLIPAQPLTPARAGLVLSLFLYRVFVCVCLCIRTPSVTQPCQTLCDHMDCVPPVSSVHGIFQARILDWVAISYPRGSSQARDGSCNLGIFCVGWQILYHCATWEAHIPSLLAANVIAATESNYIPVVGRCLLLSKPFILL